MIVRPLGQITTLDAAADIDAAYPSGNGDGFLKAKEILRATTVKIDNQSDFPIVARLVLVTGIFPTGANAGEPQSITNQTNVEDFNYYDLIVKPAETIYIRKKPVHTTIDDPDVPTYVEVPPTPGETIQIRLAPNIAQGAATGSIYASPVAVLG